MEIGISQDNFSSPSFSSSLLDAIYRSTDRCSDDEMVSHRETAREKQNHGGGAAEVFRSEEEMANFRRACMIEKWMAKKSSEKTEAWRRSAVDLQMKKPRKSDLTAESYTSSFSDSGGGLSSESEQLPLPRPKPVRTGTSGVEKEKSRHNHRDSGSDLRGWHGFSGDDSDPNPKLREGGGGFLKTKSRALKIYSELKKAKQPISPGGKLAGFLNSLFPGKPKSAAVRGDYSPSSKSTNTSTCSSATSLSRSCLSKTPSSRGKSSNGAKRSVTFSPVGGATADKDSHKSAHENKSYTKPNSNFAVAIKNNDSCKAIRNAINEEVMAHIMEKNRHVEEMAMNLRKTYQRKIQAGCELQLSFDNLRGSRVDNRSFDKLRESRVDYRSFDKLIESNINDQAFEDEDDDLMSCSSSDLFELDNLSTIGMERYSKELPVYETTHLDRTTRAASNCLIY